jgi:hypothetical protein
LLSDGCTSTRLFLQIEGCGMQADDPARSALPDECLLCDEELRRAELVAQQMAAASAVERRRWQVIILLADRVPLAEIVSTTGYRPRTIRDIARRYRVAGAVALVDKRRQSPGTPPLITGTLRHELWLVLQHPPLGGGRWTGPKVAAWIAARTGKLIYRQRGWEYLRQLQNMPEPERAT